MTRKERLMPDGTPRYVRCYDNPDNPDYTDRFTVVFSGRYKQRTGGVYWVLGMSPCPSSPQGVGMLTTYNEIVDRINGMWPPAIGRSCYLGKRIAFDDLPESCQKIVIHDYSYLWDISPVL